MNYRALRNITTSEGQRHRGDMVPEAKTWPHVRAWIGTHLEEVLESEQSPSVETPTPLRAVTAPSPATKQPPVAAPRRETARPDTGLHRSPKTDSDPGGYQPIV